MCDLLSDDGDRGALPRERHVVARLRLHHVLPRRLAVARHLLEDARILTLVEVLDRGLDAVVAVAAVVRAAVGAVTDGIGDDDGVDVGRLR